MSSDITTTEENAPAFPPTASMIAQLLTRRHAAQRCLEEIFAVYTRNVGPPRMLVYTTKDFYPARSIHVLAIVLAAQCKRRIYIYRYDRSMLADLLDKVGISYKCISFDGDLMLGNGSVISERYRNGECDFYLLDNPKDVFTKQALEEFLKGARVSIAFREPKPVDLIEDTFEIKNM